METVTKSSILDVARVLDPPLELAELIQYPHSHGRFTRYSERLDFSVATSRCYNDVYINSFSPPTARLGSYLPACFSLTYDSSTLSLELIDTFYLRILSK